LQKLEEVYYLVRKGHDLKKFLLVRGLERGYKEQAKDLGDYIEKTRPLFVKPPSGDDEDDTPPETPVVCQI